MCGKIHSLIYHNSSSVVSYSLQRWLGVTIAKSETDKAEIGDVDMDAARRKN